MIKFYITNPESSSFLASNVEWVLPLIVTILLTIISLRNEWRQKQLAEYEVGISLMEKRLAFFDRERIVLEKIIDNNKPSQVEITKLCHAEHEAMFLFGHEVKEHIDQVVSLVDEFENYKPETIPDGQGGIIIVSNAGAEKYTSKAIELFGEAISPYQLYIDFSSIGLAHSKERNKRYARKKVQEK